MAAYAYLLLLKLKYPAELCAEKIDRVLAKLPGSGKAFYGEKSLGILFLPSKHPDELIARVRLMLDAYFTDWNAVELGKWTRSKNGSVDPLEIWMDELRGRDWRRKSTAVAPTPRDKRKATN